MREHFKFTTESGIENTVEFSVVKDENAEAPYGIASRIRESSEPPIIASKRYFTYAETIAVIDMLCRYEVMPCTLCDII